MKHPAEGLTAAGAVAALVGLILGLDEGTVAVIAIALGFLPALITWLVNSGGFRGFFTRLYRGNEGYAAVELLVIVLIVVVILVVLFRFTT